MLRPIVVTALVLGLLPTLCRAQVEGAAGRSVEVAETADGESLSFRRVYVPADTPEKWPVEGRDHLPVLSSELDRLIAADGRDAKGAPQAASRPVIVSAEYAATFDGQYLVGQSLRWRVLRAEGSDGLLPIQTNLALDRLRWDRAADEGQPGESVAPILGTTDQGAQVLVVPKSGTLTALWSLGAKIVARDRWHFDLQLPPTAASQLDLRLPPGMVPSAPGVVATPLEIEGQYRKWRLQLGASTSISLVIRARSGNQSDVVPPGVRERLTYEVSQRGLELAAEFELSDLVEPLAHIDLELDAELAVLQVEIGGKPVPWSHGKGGDESRLRIRITPPTPIESKGIVRLNALASMVTDESWKLPAARLIGVAHHEGSVVCRVLSPLMLDDLSVRGGRQTSTGALASPLSGELLEFETYRRNWSVEARFALQPTVDSYTSATSITVAQNDLVARSHVRARLRDGQLFRLTADVTDGWAVESIEAAPGIHVTNWAVDRSTELPRLRIGVESGLRGDEWLELRVAARKLDWVVGKALRLEELVPLRFVGDAPSADWVSIDVPPAMQLRFEDGISPKAAELDASVAGLFPAPVPAAYVYRIDERTGHRTFTLERERTGYGATIEMTARLNGTALAETYRIQCVPGGEPVERLRVEFLSIPDATLEWPLQTVEGIAFTAERVDGARHDVWELRLVRPQQIPFTIELARVRETDSQVPIALATVPEAERQQGYVTIEAPVSLPIEVVAQGPRPVLPIEREPSRQSRVRYEYQPAVALRMGETSALTVVVGDESTAVETVVWNASLTARCDAEGRVVQQARYYLENHGAEALRLQVTEKQLIVEATVNGRYVDALLRDKVVEIPLPGDQPFCVVGIQLRSRENGWRTWHRFVPELPEPVGSVAVVRRDLRVAIPAEYSIPESSVAPTISQRLFGFFGRAADGAQETLLQGGGANANGMDSDDARAFLRALGRTAFGRERSANWGEAIARCADELAREGRGTLLIDRAALASLDIGSDSKLPLSVAGDSLLAQARALLDQAALVLVAQPEGLVLTRRDFSQAVEQRGPFAGQHGRLVIASHWPASSGHPWSRETNSALVVASPAWRVYHFALPSSGEFAIPIVDRESIALSGWLLLVISAAVGAWTLRGRVRVLVALLAAAVVGALLLPAHLVPVGSALVMGLAIALLIEVIRMGQSVSLDEPSTAAHDSQRSSQVRLAPTALLLLLVVLLTPSHGADRVGNAGSYRVLIPVDDAGEPVGRHAYVPAEFWERLTERTNPDSTPWILSEPQYSGELKWDVGRRRLVLPSLTANYRLLVRVAHASVSVPLAVESSMSGWSVLVNGRPAAAQFDRNEQVLRFAVESAGMHDVQLSFAPVVQYAPNRALLETLLPAVSTSKIELIVPPELPLVTFLSAQGIERRNEEARTILAQLGATDRLAIEWQSVPGPVVEDYLPDVDKLLWLRVRPGAVTIEARFNFIKPAGMSTFEIAADRGLRYLPDAEGAIVPEATAIDSTRQVLTFSLPSEQAGPMSIRARYLFPERSGLGQITLPHIDSTSGHTRRRWLAMTIDPTLALEEARGEPMQAASVDDFLIAWGNTQSRPDRAFEVSAESGLSPVAVRPVESRLEVSPQLQLTAGQGRLDVQYQAAIKSASPREFLHRVQVPPELHVKRVSVTSGRSEQLSRWRKDTQGQIVVFLSSLPEGDQVLQLTGWMDVAAEGAVAIPQIEIPGAQIGPSVLQVARRADTLVSVQDDLNAALADANVPPAMESDVDVAPVGRFEVDGEIPRGTLALSANRPVVDATLVTRLMRATEGWKVAVDCHVNVQQGAVDALRFRVPDTWRGPFEASPELSIRTGQATAGSQLLVVRLPTALTAAGQIRWEAPLTGTEDELAIPQIELIAEGRVEQYVAMPAADRDQWRLSGMRPTDAPATVATDNQLAGVYEYFHCFDAAYSASFISERDAQRDVEVVNAAVDIYRDELNQAYGVARFDLIPHGRAVAIVVLADGARPVQATVDGVPTFLAPISQGRWKVALQSDLQAQRLSVTFVGGAGTATVAPIAAPRIEAAMPEAAARLRIRAAGSLHVAGTEPISAVEFDRIELAHCLAMVELEADGDSKSGPQNWLARARQAERSLARSQTLAVEPVRADESAEDVQQELGRNDSSQVAVNGLQLVRGDSSAALAATELSGADMYELCFALDAPAETLELSPMRPGHDWWPRLGLAMLVMAGTVVLWRNPFWQHVPVLLYRTPALLLAAVGLVWWAWMSPSDLGLALFVLAMLSLVVEAVRRRLVATGRWRVVSTREPDSRVS